MKPLTLSVFWLVVALGNCDESCPEAKVLGVGDSDKLTILRGCPGLPGTPGQKGEPGLPGEKGPKGEKGDKGDITDPENIYVARNCKELLDQGSFLSGWYKIYPEGIIPLSVYCDMDTDGGGWIVFQRRVDGSVDFFRDWNIYKKGFGSQLSEFWLGNDNIHRLTSSGTYQLRIDLSDFEGGHSFATYNSFSLSEEADNYKLNLGDYSGGTAGDSLSYHRNRPFTTKDKDHDIHEDNCADRFKGAWWYGGCHDSNLNAQYLRGKHTSYADGMMWLAGKGYYYSYKTTEMKFRPILAA